MSILNFKRLLKHPLFSGSVIMVGGSMAVNVVNYVYHLLMGRVLGPVNYGTLASLYSLLYITTIVPVSTSVTIVKFISSAKDEKEKARVYKSVRSLALKVASILSLVILVLSPFVSKFLNISEIWGVVLVAPIVFFSIAALINQSTAQGELNFLGSVVPNFVSGAGKLIIGISLVFLGFSVVGAMWGIVIAVIGAYLVSGMFVKRISKQRSDDDYDVKPLLVYSLPALIQALAFTSIFTVDVILVKHFFDPFQAGIYAALSTLGKIIYFASTPIASTMFPIVAGKRSRGESHVKVFYLSLAVTAAVSFAIAALYWLLPEFVIRSLYGEKYLLAAGSLVWMGLFMATYSISVLLVNYALSVGETTVAYLPLGAAAIQCVLLWSFHSSLDQVMQISFGTTLLLVVILLLELIYNRRNYLYINEKK